MASSDQELAFLDLTDIDEAERNHLQQVLYTVSPNLELPWEVQNEEHCSSQGYESSPFAVAPIPHPTLQGVFLPQPLFTAAPAAVAVGLDPSVAAEPPNGPTVGLVPSVDSLECDPRSGASPSPPATSHLQSYGIASGDGGFPSDNSPVQMLPVPQSATSVPPSTQPVITTMYQMIGHAGMQLPNVYVGNVTANVNVHSFVGPPLTPYTSHLSQPAVFSPGEVQVPRESSGSPNAGRNGMGLRRSRNSKPINKRVDGPFGLRTPGVGHGHEVLPPAVVESPAGHPLPQNYMIPVPSMHPAHAFHQPFYSTPTQPPHGSHLSQHPSAQHATGPPLIVPLFHAPLYNAYHPQATAGGPLVYSASPNIVAAPVTTTEHSVGIPYQVNNGPSERMVPEGRENDVPIHEHQNFYENEVITLKNSNDPEINEARFHQETEAYKLTSPVDAVNSNVVPSPSTANDVFENETTVAINVAEQEPKEAIEKVGDASLESAQTSESEQLIELPKVIPEIKSVSNETLNKVPGEGESVVSAFSNSTKVLSENVPEEPKSCVISTPSPKESVEATPALPAKTVSETNNEIVWQQTDANDSSPAAPVVTNTQEKTWASLFNKSSRNNLTSDGPMILATGIAANNSASKTLAAVRPFQNAVTVSGSHGSRKPSESTSANDSPKDLQQLGQPGLPAPSMANDPHLYRLGELLLKYQLDHRTISLQPRGLTNRSNWCYINSTLQALLACPPFYNLMKALPLPPQRSGKSSTPIIDSMVEFVSEFNPLSAASRVNRKEKAQRKDDAIEVQVGTAFEPSYIYKMLSNIQSDTFKVEGRQEDAEEFFSCLLNALNDEMLELIKLVKDSSSDTNISNGDLSNGDNANQNFDDDNDTEWKVMTKRNKGSVTRRAEFERTPVSDIFRGQLRSRVQRAGDYSDNVQPFFTLQLDIEKAQSVRDALDLLVGRDQLEGVTCSRTNQEVEAWQQVTIEELPLVLVLHLKWFNYKMDGCSKIVKTVEFPIDLKFDGKLLSSYNKYNPKQKQYKLFAVVYHDGKEATKGHYITDVYHVGYAGWVRYDDSSVKAIQEAQMLHPRGSRVPYLLYYRRCDTIGSTAATPDKR